jgi:hypothetical protein
VESNRFKTATLAAHVVRHGFDLRHEGRGQRVGRQARCGAEIADALGPSNATLQHVNAQERGLHRAALPWRRVWLNGNRTSLCDGISVPGNRGLKPHGYNRFSLRERSRWPPRDIDPIQLPRCGLS